jgi:hypothetical protein
MYENVKMIPVKTIPGMWGEKEIKESGGGDELKYEIFGTL